MKILNENDKYHFEACVSLKYDASRSILIVGVLQAKNLKRMDVIGMSDPYVKCWLLLGGKKVEKRKSPVYKCNLNPTFNQV